MVSNGWFAVEESPFRCESALCANEEGLSCSGNYPIRTGEDGGVFTLPTEQPAGVQGSFELLRRFLRKVTTFSIHKGRFDKTTATLRVHSIFGAFYPKSLRFDSTIF
jgi:hypothetical protein